MLDTTSDRTTRTTRSARIRRARTTAGVGAAALLAAVLAPTGAASAAPPDLPPGKVMGGLLSPLSVAQSAEGTVFVTENFAGKLWRKRPGQRGRTLLWQARPGNEVGAVSFHRKVLTFAVSTPQGGGKVLRRTRTGGARLVVDTAAYERRVNPDGRTVYGVRGIPADCEAQWPTEEAGPAEYSGIVESHPYATLRSGRTTYVADAAMNAVLAVGPAGRARTLAVLPPAPVRITEGLADGLGLPDCAVGRRYFFEPVPTDVERGPGGMLYVTTLPGGPEDPSLGARGSVYRINPANGRVARVASGLMSPTGLAVAPDRDLYVAELFGGRISRVPAGRSTPRAWRSVDLPGDVDWVRGRLIGTVQVMTGLSGQPGDAPRGEVRRWRP